MTGGGGRGAAVSFSRSELAKTRLQFTYDHPAPGRDVQLAGVKAILTHLAKGTNETADQRPLLIVRTFTASTEKRSGKKLQELYRAALGSERFRLASKWFRAVHLDSQVMRKDHPYRALYRSKNPAHIILATPDGKKIVRLLGKPTERVTWPAIVSVLRRSYTKNPTKAIKGLEQLLNHLDTWDSQKKDLDERFVAAKRKKKFRKLEKFEKQLSAMDAQLKAMLEQERDLRALGLKKPKRKPAKKKARDDDFDDFGF